MGEIRIRNLDEATLARLDLRARELGVSAEDLLRDLIAQTFGASRDKAVGTAYQNRLLLLSSYTGLP